MNSLLIEPLKCLSESRFFNKNDVYEVLFDKKCDKRYPETAVQKFLNLNRQSFDFLGIEVIATGSGNDFNLQFKTSNKIGSIPIRMPYDGISKKDLQVVPRFDSGENVFSELTELLVTLGHSITPDYLEEEILNSPNQLRPPLYYEAAKFIEFMNGVIRYNWQKFNVVNKIYSYPKANTDWNKYATKSFDIAQTLKYPCRSSVLSLDHLEMQKLKYVFEIACSILSSSDVPVHIRLKYQNIIYSMKKQLEKIGVVRVDNFAIRTSDPTCVSLAKKQGNIILNKNSNLCTAWRMDVAELFERYVQHIVIACAKDFAFSALPNSKISGNGNVPRWGLKYLEPDIMVKHENSIFMADAKYKSNYYAINVSSDILRETHRSDLHQLLAYCSFEPQANKVGALVYPSQHVDFRKLEYTEHTCQQYVKVYLCGIPFTVTKIGEVKREFKDKVLSKILFSQTE